MRWNDPVLWTPVILIVVAVTLIWMIRNDTVIRTRKQIEHNARHRDPMVLRQRAGHIEDQARERGFKFTPAVSEDHVPRLDMSLFFPVSSRNRVTGRARGVVTQIADVTGSDGWAATIGWAVNPLAGAGLFKLTPGRGASRQIHVKDNPALATTLESFARSASGQWMFTSTRTHVCCWRPDRKGRPMLVEPWEVPALVDALSELVEVLHTHRQLQR